MEILLASRVGIGGNHQSPEGPGGGVNCIGESSISSIREMSSRFGNSVRTFSSTATMKSRRTLHSIGLPRNCFSFTSYCTDKSRIKY